jgi:hypothetical protein
LRIRARPVFHCRHPDVEIPVIHRLAAPEQDASQKMNLVDIILRVVFRLLQNAFVQFFLLIVFSVILGQAISIMNTRYAAKGDETFSGCRVAIFEAGAATPRLVHISSPELEAFRGKGVFLPPDESGSGRTDDPLYYEYSVKKNGDDVLVSVFTDNADYQIWCEYSVRDDAVFPVKWRFFGPGHALMGFTIALFVFCLLQCLFSIVLWYLNRARAKK